MARSRLEFHEILCDILGSRNVYFQPPPTIQMKYDAIVYSLDDIDTKNANDTKYIKNRRYFVRVISRKADNDLVDKILDLPKSSLSRAYTSDNLYYWAFEVYF